jgi:lipoprotein-anchoring transpeptidase ErfK/SrfK
MRKLAICAAMSVAAVCCVSGSASAQWRNYDGYQVQPSYPDYPGNSYNGYPAYPDGDPYAPPPRRQPPPPNYTRAAPPDGYSVDTPPRGQRTYEAALPPANSADELDAAALQSPRTARVVPNPTNERPGTIIVDTASRHLYYVEADGRAIEYGIGVGREGFAWKGMAQVGRKAEWPRWIPPADMLKRRPDLPVSMDGGLENPLGARALYLFKGKTDTLFRIHGTNEPDSIGKAVSSGCIRMMNADVMDLYRRVPVGARVVVL